MIELSSFKSTRKLNFIPELSYNLGVFEYEKKNRRLLPLHGMCFVENFAMGNKWQFETKEVIKTSLPSLAMQFWLTLLISLILHGAYCQKLLGILHLTMGYLVRECRDVNDDFAIFKKFQPGFSVQKWKAPN